jgi:hypothetical protein
LAGGDLMAEKFDDRISRRKMLKRIGAGTAIAWSAPVLSSLRTPAFARHIYPARCPGDDWDCGELIVECAPTEPGLLAPCVCDVDVSGNTFCWQNFFCPPTTCTSNADCDPGEACVTSCCGQTCAPPCGHTFEDQTITSGPTAAGV